jgi:hypothetical protein
MDHAVALVQAYLEVNGYFTVAEHPVLSALPAGGYASATDIDLLALRLCSAGGMVAAGDDGGATDSFEPDPHLEIPSASADLLLIEVKEGRAELNRGAKDPDILRAVLHRSGLRSGENTERALEELVRHGETTWPGDVRVRILAFGSIVDPKIVKGFRAIPLTHVTRFLTEHIEKNWHALRHAQIRQQAFGFLALLEQIRRAALAEPEDP